MKKAFSLLITLIALILYVFPVLGETTITVNGKGETQITADTAVLSLGVSARDRDVLTAQQKVNTAIAAIRKSLTDAGIKEEYINTDYINIYAMYEYANDQEQITAYNANSTLAIRIEDIGSIGLLIDTAFAAGANTLNGIFFSSSSTGEANAESLKKAVADAKAKAETLAETAGMHITGIEKINESNTYTYDNSVGNFSAKGISRAEAAQADAGTVIQAARLVVNAEVTVTFTAE